MYYITRIRRDKNRDIDAIYIKDTKDSIEECISKADFNHYLISGVEIKGADKLHPLASTPSPQILDSKLKLLKGVSIELSRSGDMVQYLRIPKGVELFADGIPRLGDCCVYGGGGTLVVRNFVNLNYDAFYNYFSNVHEIMSSEFKYTRIRDQMKSVYDRYELTLRLQNLDNDHICDVFEGLHYFELSYNGMNKVLKLDDTASAHRIYTLLNVKMYERDQIDTRKLFGSYLDLFDESGKCLVSENDRIAQLEFFNKVVIKRFYTGSFGTRLSHNKYDCAVVAREFIDVLDTLKSALNEEAYKDVESKIVRIFQIVHDGTKYRAAVLQKLATVFTRRLVEEVGNEDFTLYASLLRYYSYGGRDAIVVRDLMSVSEEFLKQFSLRS